MTTLIAIQGDNWAMVGADRRSTDSVDVPVVMATSKIVENNGYLIAGAGSVRNCNVIQYGFTPPRPTGDLDKFITRRFIPAMREAFQKAGVDLKAESQAAEHDSEFIILIKGRVYLVSDDYSWERSTEGVYVGGSGGRLALGAIKALGWNSRDPKVTKGNLEIALQIASECDINSAPPFDILLQKANA